MCFQMFNTNQLSFFMAIISFMWINIAFIPQNNLFFSNEYPRYTRIFNPI